MSDFDPEKIRFRAVERYSIGWTDPRGVFSSPMEPEWLAGKTMTVAYCNHYQRDTPHADGICIYHRAGECRGTL